MNLKLISRSIGYALLVSALFMMLSVVVSLIDGHDTALAPLLVSSLLTFIVGIFPFIFVRRTEKLSLKDGYLIIVLSWLLSFIFGMLPYALWGGPFTLENAWFESVSGFTTTGATILSDIESLPRSLLFWRSATHFIGGLGVVVFLLLIIPNSSPAKMRLTNMELSSLSRGAYSVRAGKTIHIFTMVYLAIAVLSFIAYLLAGMDPFDAICHAFSVSATGGFSTKNMSIASFANPAVEVITVVFMLASSIHFGLIYLCVINRTLKPLNNPVVKFYFLSIVAITLLITLFLRISEVEQNFGTALWHGFFQTMCAITTSGFAITDNVVWPMSAGVLIIFAGFMCACAGSTSGGVKADRMLVFIKAVGCQLDRILHPSSVSEVKLGTRVLRDDEVYPHILYLVIYCAFAVLSILLVSASGASNIVAFSGSFASLGNIGPGLGEIGFMGNYDAVPSFAKFVFTIDMFLGRVEIFPIIAILAMIYEVPRRRR